MVGGSIGWAGIATVTIGSQDRVGDARLRPGRPARRCRPPRPRPPARRSSPRKASTLEMRPTSTWLCRRAPSALTCMLVRTVPGTGCGRSAAGQDRDWPPGSFAQHCEGLAGFDRRRRHVADDPGRKAALDPCVRLQETPTPSPGRPEANQGRENRAARRWASSAAKRSNTWSWTTCGCASGGVDLVDDNDRLQPALQRLARPRI